MKVYTAYITKKDGTRVYAKTYGKKCFCFEVGDRRKPRTDNSADKSRQAQKSK